MLKIISGGQTGVDTAGLMAARNCGLTTGGYMPKGFITESSPAPHYKNLYGIQELGSSDYTVRTDMNIKSSDVTMIFHNGTVGRGTRRTMDKCLSFGKKHFVYNMLENMNDLNGFIDIIANDLITCREKFGDDFTVNIAGTRGSKLGMKNENILVIVLTEAFNKYKLHTQSYQ
jgi:hypothetical protein